eukprot:254075_1
MEMSLIQHTIWFIFLIERLSATAWCQNHHQCAATSITDTDVWCIGYYGCAFSNIYASQSIACLGDNACRGKESQGRPTLDADWSISCGGTNSCFFTNMVANNWNSRVDCNAKHSCANSIINKPGTSGDVYCTALESCAGSEITSGRNVQCAAQNSCGQYSLISVATPMINSRITAGQIVQCEGWKSCYKATIVSGHKVEVTGQNGAEDATITAGWIEANAKSAVSEATITLSGGHPTLRLLTLSAGFSGYYADVYCDSGDCHINCEHGTACLAMSVTYNVGNGATVDVKVNPYGMPNNYQQCPSNTAVGVIVNGINCPSVQELPPGITWEDYVQKRREDRLKDPEYLKYIENKKFDDDFGDGIIIKIPEDNININVDIPRYYNNDVIIGLVLLVILFMLGMMSAFSIIYGCNHFKQANDEVKVLTM